MDKLKIIGGHPLYGQIRIGGAKNAALPLLAASLLTKEPTTLTNVPHVKDVATMISFLQLLGCDISMDGEVSDSSHLGDTVCIRPSSKISTEAPYDLVRKMRASILVLGPLLAHYGHAEISLPGGCAIGTRPINLHLQAMEALGAQIKLDAGYVKAMAPKGLTGNTYVFPMVSVTGTENLMMAACLAQGKTTIINAAREPEISDLGHMLIKMGAKIKGLGTETIIIEGSSHLKGTQHRVIPDRIETGTYAMAAAITGGEVDLVNTDITLLSAAISSLEEAGVRFEPHAQGVKVIGPSQLKPVDIQTTPYPGYPTDLQAQFMALMTLSKGSAVITERIFENRFMHVAELQRLGANIQVHGDTATVKGVDQLLGAEVMATDLRASVALVLAALAAKGETIINRIYHLDRGYEFIESKLSRCHANIKRIA